MPDLRHAYTALRLRVLRPVVRARGALLRRWRPAPAAVERPEVDDVPILVVGCHRSGTSLLRRCLDSHSRIAVPAETLFLEYLGAMVGVPKADKGFAAVGQDLENVRAELRDRVTGWFRAYARSRGKPRWADKSPGTANALEGVDHLLYARARYVWITRDGMDVATSLGGATPVWWQVEPLLRFEADPFVAAAHYWVDLNAKIARFAADRPDRVHRLRYEDLVERPEPVLREVLAFLGEAFEPSILDFNRAEHTGGPEDHHVSTTTGFEDNRGKHRRLPIETQRRMWAVVAPTMASLGYPARSY